MHNVTTDRPFTSNWQAARLLLSVLAGSHAAQAALYVLAASPSNNYNARYDQLLLQVSPNQPLRQLRRIGRAGEGSQAIRIDHQGRMIAIEMPAVRPTRIELVSMDEPGVPASRQIDTTKLNQSIWEPWSPRIAGMLKQAGKAGLEPSPRFLDSRIIVRSGAPWLVMRFDSAAGRALLGFPLTLKSTQPEVPVSVDEWNLVRTAGQFGHFNLGSSDSQRGQAREGRLCHNTASERCEISGSRVLQALRRPGSSIGTTKWQSR